MNKRELESVMKRYGDTQETLAEALGLSRTRLNCKMNESRNATFNQPEIKQIKQRYNLSAKEVEIIFFTDCVSKKDTAI